MLLLLVYVDDILIIGENHIDIQQVIQDLHQQFALKTLGAARYFLEFEVTRILSSLYLSQSKYAADLLKKTNMANAKPISTPMCLNHKLSLTDGVPFEGINTNNAQPEFYPLL